MKFSIRPLAIIMISIFVFLVIITIYADENSFQLTGKEMHEKLGSMDYVLDQKEFKQLPHPILIDIRNQKLFMVDDKASAQNVPLSTLLDDANKALFEKEEPKVILAYDPIDAHEAWMLLTQLGYSQLYVAQPIDSVER